MVSGLAIVLYSHKRGREFTSLNLYGPYVERVAYWEKMFKIDILNQNYLILGSDLNFSFERAEIWGQVARVNPLTNFFIQRLEDNGLLDVESIKLQPTWRKKWVGAKRNAKRLDKFIISKGILNDYFGIREWIGSGGDSDHFHIFLEMSKVGNKPPSPFKYNPSWLEEKEFVTLLKEN